MAISKESYQKRQRQIKQQKAQREKRERAAEKKANAHKGKSLEDMMAYIDENGNISSTPPPTAAPGTGNE
jgi:hypothetical protein